MSVSDSFPDNRRFTMLYYSIPEEQYELAYAALMDLPFLGITEGFDELSICFYAEDYSSELLRTIEQQFIDLHVQAVFEKQEEIEERNWNEEWEQSIEPVWVSDRTVITPDWKQHEVEAEFKILINPKMSFGTGHHQTTRMMAQLMETLVQRASTWVDAGTGTGVLAILAAKLGATEVIAFDNDTWSIENARENVRLNNVDDMVKLSHEDIFSFLFPPANGIAANLHKNVLIPVFPHFYQGLLYNRGDLLVSGILRYDFDEVNEAASAAGFEHVETRADGDWVAIHYQIV